MTSLWARRPFWTRKLAQLYTLVHESYVAPLTGQPGLPVLTGPGDLSVMFLGHSSFLVGIDGKNLLIDPVLATRLILLRRQRRAGIRLQDLPAIDAVLVTHAHMDHLNRPTLRHIARSTRRLTGQAPAIVVPRGVEDLVANLGFREVRTLSWWDSTQVAGVHVTLTPCRHWGARMFRDTHRQYGGFHLESGGRTLIHSGDTAYFPGFREIGQRLARAEVALLPIGAYFPDSYRAVHTSPEEAVRLFQDIEAQNMVPMHFGTFRLGREPMDEPVQRLHAEASRLHLEDRIRVLAEGVTWLVPRSTGSQAPLQDPHPQLASR